MKNKLFLFLVCVGVAASFWQWQKKVHHLRDSYLFHGAITVAEGPHYKICRSLNPLVETHVVAFPLDNKRKFYKDVFDFVSRATPQQKLDYVRAIAKTAEDLDIVRQGYRIIANSDASSPYLRTYSPHILHGQVLEADYQNMLKNNAIPAFCFHIVSDKGSLSSTTVTPYSIRNQQVKRARLDGYQGSQTYADCAISRIAREANTPRNILFEDDVHFKSFKDHRPKALFHALVVSKESYFSHYEVFRKADAETIQNLFQMIVRTGEHAPSKAFRIVSNHGLGAHQDEPVAHFHIMGGEPLGAFCYPYDLYYNELTTDLVMDHPTAGAEKRSLTSLGAAHLVKAEFVDNTFHMDFAATAITYARDYL